MNHVTLRRIKEEGGFEAIKAVREGNIFIIDEKIVSRPTMRLLDGIYEIGRFLYPSVFNDVSVFLSKPVITRAAFAEMFVKMMNIKPTIGMVISRMWTTGEIVTSLLKRQYTGGFFRTLKRTCSIRINL